MLIINMSTYIKTGCETSSTIMQWYYSLIQVTTKVFIIHAVVVHHLSFVWIQSVIDVTVGSQISQCPRTRVWFRTETSTKEIAEIILLWLRPNPCRTSNTCITTRMVGTNQQGKLLASNETLALKARHLGGSAFCNFYRLGVPEQALGWIPLGFMEDKPICHVYTVFLCVLLA